MNLSAWVNPTTTVTDIHSGLNTTEVERIYQPGTVDELRQIVGHSRAFKRPFAITGKRHAMGGQQFLSRKTVIDTSSLNRLLELNADTGLVKVEAGATWPGLLAQLSNNQRNDQVWTFRQKQTGADHLSLGGALAANIHGRGLRYRPFIADVQAFELLTPQGELLECSRETNPELFRLVAGGYGLFGIVTHVTLRLVKRHAVERKVEITTTQSLIQRFKDRIAAGYLYGDFQFSCDELSSDFLHRGVFSCYRPVEKRLTPPTLLQRLERDHWNELLYLAHVAKSEAFKRYAEHYCKTDGQVYWSDLMQFSTYTNGYHRQIDERLGSGCAGSEIITELFVPREGLEEFLSQVRNEARLQKMNIIYGTIRLIEADSESYLAWAKKPYACVILNLHVDHRTHAMQAAKRHFRLLIDIALGMGGSFYLTYHRYARRDQIERAYPQFVSFLLEKRAHDPEQLLQSDWYRHYRGMFHDKL